MSRRVFFFVQSLLGIGHLVRAKRLAEALAAAGAQVTVASGGMPVDGLDFAACDVIQLPAITAGPGGFSDLRMADGSVLDERGKETRKAALLNAFSASRADILLIEAFPFARRAQRFELLPLVGTARQQKPDILIACSVRDILQRSRAVERRLEAAAVIRDYFDLVLVHGDQRLASFEVSFPEASLFSEIVIHTGLIGPQKTEPPAGGDHEVIVAAGGGRVGAELLEAAMAARPLSSLSQARWLVVGGPHLEDAAFHRLVAKGASAGIDVVRFLADLPARYAAAKLVVSQAGYNTVADVLSAGCCSVLVPFAEAGESEQSERAQLLAKAGFAVTVDPQGLTPALVAAAIDKAVTQARPVWRPALDGARRSAEVLLAHHHAPFAFDASVI